MKTKIKSLKKLKLMASAIKHKDFYSNGGLAMYEYKFADQLTNVDTGSKSLADQIKEIEQKYKFNLINNASKNDISLNLDKLEFNPISENEVVDQAKKSLEAYKTAGEQKIYDDFTLGSNKLDTQLDKNMSSYEKNRDKIQDLYDTAIEDYKNKALKKGLARSSIVINKIEAFDSTRLKELEQIDKETTNAINKYNNEKSILETQKENALSNFDIAYAVKLSEKINSINKALNDEEQKIIKYNNQIAEKEAEYELSQQKHNIKEEEEFRKQNTFILDYIAKYGSTGFDKLKNEEISSVAKNYLDSLSKNQALYELLSNKDYKNLLGKNYDSILKYVNDRED